MTWSRGLHVLAARCAFRAGRVVIKWRAQQVIPPDRPQRAPH
jgi:hypothetical protein